MSAEKISVNATQFKCIQSNAHQCGVLSRASRALIQCHNIRDVNLVLHQILIDLELSGFYAFSTNQLKKKQHFGEPMSVDEQSNVVNLLRKNDKVCYRDNLLAVKTAHLILVARFPEDMDDEIIDLSRDNIAIFIDTVATWLKISEHSHTDKKQAYHEKLSSADKLNEVLGYLKVYNAHLIDSNREIYKHLLSSMISQFPVLGLEGDQEEAILNIIDQAQAKQESILDAHIGYNEDLTKILSELIGNLIGSIDEELKAGQDPFSPINSKDLF